MEGSGVETDGGFRDCKISVASEVVLGATMLKDENVSGTATYSNNDSLQP